MEENRLGGGSALHRSHPHAERFSSHRLPFNHLWHELSVVVVLDDLFDNLGGDVVLVEVDQTIHELSVRKHLKTIGPKRPVKPMGQRRQFPESHLLGRVPVRLRVQQDANGLHHAHHELRWSLEIFDLQGGCRRK